MPRSGPNGTYTLPGAQATQVAGTPIPSAVNNQGWSDAEQTFNTPQPIAYGGTGAATAVGGADALSPAFVNVASAATTNIGAASSPNVNITGTTTITAFDNFAAGAKRLVKFTGILTLTHNATSLILPGGTNITTAPGDFALFVSQGSGNWECVGYQRANGAALGSSVNAGYLYGLTISNNVTDATNDIDIAVGAAASDGSTPALMTLATGLTKRLDAVWAVGTNQGMLASGAALADTTYHIFLIKRPDTGVVDIAADTSVTGANIAANTNAAYTLVRRIWSIVRVSGAIKPFYQFGDDCFWGTPVQSYNVDNPGTAAVTITTTVPIGIIVTTNISFETGNGGTNHYVFFSPLASTDIAPSSATGQAGVAGTVRFTIGKIATITNTSGQIRMRTSASAAGDTFTVNTLGYADTRGRI